MDPLLEHFGHSAVFALLVGAGVGFPGLALFGFLLVDSVRAAENRWLPSLQALDLDSPP